MTPVQDKIETTGRQKQVRTTARLFWRGLEFSLLLALAASCAFAQAAAEYGSTTSGVAASMNGINNLVNKVKIPDTSTGPKPSVIMSQPSKDSKVNPNYILDTMKSGSVEANRKALERRAGKDAAKLMLSSSPTDAYVKINGKPVGRTPILLIVPPGQYKVSMEGQRMEHAEQSVDLLPKETRKYSLKLKQFYPTQVKIQLH